MSRPLAPLRVALLLVVWSLGGCAGDGAGALVELPAAGADGSSSAEDVAATDGAVDRVADIPDVLTDAASPADTPLPDEAEDASDAGDRSEASASQDTPSELAPSDIAPMDEQAAPADPGEPIRCELDPACALLAQRVGYGRRAVGGRDGARCTVTSLGDSGAGTLRACLGRGAGQWITFSVDGDLRLRSDLSIPSRTTIDGRGRYVRIFEKGFDIRGVRDVIITNLIFKAGDGGDDNDAIAVKDGARDVWIHHVSFSDYGDGLLDITRQATDVTVSWCKFSNHDKTLLISANDDHTADSVIRVTLHHNWFRETRQRHPRARHGRVHLFNNLYDRWVAYGAGCSTDSQCRLQNNLFIAGDDADAVLTRVGEDRGSGRVRSDGDVRRHGAVIRERERASVFEPADDYAYSLDAAGDALEAAIRAGAGWQGTIP